MSLWKWLGLGGDASDAGPGETDTIRRIASRLERLPPDQAKYLGGFAYVLARIANADLRIDETEAAEMERIVRRLAGLAPEEAALVIEIARSQAKLLGETEDYVVTREFRKVSTREQRAHLLECLFAVAAADGTISGIESAAIVSIGDELGFTRPEINALRADYRDKLAELKRDD